MLLPPAEDRLKGLGNPASTCPCPHLCGLWPIPPASPPRRHLPKVPAISQGQGDLSAGQDSHTGGGGKQMPSSGLPRLHSGLEPVFWLEGRLPLWPSVGRYCGSTGAPGPADKGLWQQVAQHSRSTPAGPHTSSPQPQGFGNKAGVGVTAACMMIPQQPPQSTYTPH